MRSDIRKDSECDWMCLIATRVAPSGRYVFRIIGQQGALVPIGSPSDRQPLTRIRGRVAYHLGLAR